MTDNAAYTWTAAVQETVDATLNRTVSSGAARCSLSGRAVLLLLDLHPLSLDIRGSWHAGNTLQPTFSCKRLRLVDSHRPLLLGRWCCAICQGQLSACGPESFVPACIYAIVPAQASAARRTTRATSRRYRARQTALMSPSAAAATSTSPGSQARPSGSRTTGAKGGGLWPCKPAAASMP